MAKGRSRRYAAGVTPHRASRIVLGIALALGSLPACRVPQTDAQRADAIVARTMSPFCPGRTLASCPSPTAAEWRQEIREWVNAGVTTEEIRRRLEARAATTDLSGTPSTRLGWALPVVLTALSLALLGVVIWSRLFLHRHTPWQCLAGSMAGAGAVLLLWPLLGA